jgi:ATP-dependent Lhr-like helicase
VAVVAATDPANPYGVTLKWPGTTTSHSGEAGPTARGPTRSIGATAILVNGRLAAYLARGDRVLLTWLPDGEPLRSKTAHAVAQILIDRARTGGETPRGMLIEEIDGMPATAHVLAPYLIETGFISGAMGMQATFVKGVR